MWTESLPTIFPETSTTDPLSAWCAVFVQRYTPFENKRSRTRAMQPFPVHTSNLQRKCFSFDDFHHICSHCHQTNEKLSGNWSLFQAYFGRRYLSNELFQGCNENSVVFRGQTFLIGSDSDENTTNSFIQGGAHERQAHRAAASSLHYTYHICYPEHRQKMFERRNYKA